MVRYVDVGIWYGEIYFTNSKANRSLLISNKFCNPTIYGYTNFTLLPVEADL